MNNQTSGETTYIFDMDGTILDLHFDRYVWNHCLPSKISDKLDISFEAASVLVKNKLNPLKNTLNWYSLDYWSQQFDVDISEIETEVAHLIKPRPGAIDYLQSLQNKGLMILASNADPKSMNRKLSITKIARYFDVIVSSHEIGFCKEQLQFWRQLQIRVNFCLNKTALIDDNLTVLRTAEKFGIKTLYGIKNPSSQGPSISDPKFKLIHDFEEIN
jgi:5'-nucleotidase